MIKRKQCKMTRVEEQNQNGKKKSKKTERSKQRQEGNESVSDEGTTSRSLWAVRSLRN